MSEGTRESFSTVTLRPSRSAGPAAPVATLAVVHPPELARRIPLPREERVLGRQVDDAACRLEDGSVSRRHLGIQWDGRARAHIVADLDSHNGSWLGGKPLTAPSVLVDGAVLRFGAAVAVYEQRDAGASDAPSLLEAIPGSSPPMAKLRRQLATAAGDPSPVLVVGPTGAGKEHVVRALHRLSNRKGRLVSVNVAELSPQLAESQLFGHVRGAFTGADQAQPGLFRAADGGTLFLDEIGELPAELQPKLLRVIQEGEVRPVGSTRAEAVDVRVVAATHRDLRKEVDAGRFRRDLWARICLWELSVPGLAGRRADILAWIDLLHHRWCAERHRPRRGSLRFTPEAVEALLLATWPENLRGVDRLVHRLAVDSDDSPISAARLAGLLDVAAEPEEAPATPKVKQAPPQTAEQLADVLGRFGGSVRAAARWYGRDRRQIYRWMEALGVGREALSPEDAV